MDDGESSTVPVTLFYMPPGHDAWIVGNRRFVMIDREKVPSPRFDLSITGMCGTIFYGSMSPFAVYFLPGFFTIV